MSWHFLQGQEEASWEGSSLDGAPSALSSLIPTAAECSSPASETDCCPASRSGTTCEPSTASPGAETSMSSAEDSPAKTSAVPGRGQESQGSGRGSGPSSLASLAKWDRATSSWKTRQCSLFGGLASFSGTWPRWGLMRDGECFPLVPLVLHTCDADCSLWHTPVARDYKGYTTRSGESICNQLRRTFGGSGCPHPNWQEAVMLWPPGWTDLEPLETDRFQRWLDSHGRR